MMLVRATGLVRSMPRMARVGLPMTRCMSGYAPAHWKTDTENDTINKTTIDFMPVPQGSWQEHHDKRNMKWNLMIAGSSLFLAATIFALYKFDCFFFHDQPDYKTIEIEEY